MSCYCEPLSYSDRWEDPTFRSVETIYCLVSITLSCLPETMGYASFFPGSHVIYANTGDTFSKPSSFKLMTSRSKSVLRPLVLLKRTRPVRPSQCACRHKLTASPTGILSSRFSQPHQSHQLKRKTFSFSGLIRNSVCLWPSPSTSATK